MKLKRLTIGVLLFVGVVITIAITRVVIKQTTSEIKIIPGENLVDSVHIFRYNMDERI